MNARQLVEAKSWKRLWIDTTHPGMPWQVGDLVQLRGAPGWRLGVVLDPRTVSSEGTMNLLKYNKYPKVPVKWSIQNRPRTWHGESDSTMVDYVNPDQLEKADLSLIGSKTLDLYFKTLGIDKSHVRKHALKALKDRFVEDFDTAKAGRATASLGSQAVAGGDITGNKADTREPPKAKQVVDKVYKSEADKRRPATDTTGHYTLPIWNYTDSMGPNFTGHRARFRAVGDGEAKLRFRDLKKGMVVNFWSPWYAAQIAREHGVPGHSGAKYGSTVHRIAGFDEKGRPITKGDNNDEADHGYLTPEHTFGVAVGMNPSSAQPNGSRDPKYGLVLPGTA